ncbi:hypothetical protein WBG99_11650 [Streptomyces sp. TG1A-60]|uniref:hypothetical protein n=1 Tax=Streptomyces sp. TG1A-60 TaxID=3129111 RepID=UPI0030CB8C18
MRAPWRDRSPIPHDPRAASVVRAALRALLRATRLGCVSDTVELLASELVTAVPPRDAA